MAMAPAVDKVRMGWIKAADSTGDRFKPVRFLPTPDNDEPGSQESTRSRKNFRMPIFGPAARPALLPTAATD
jgi:hypothetical protein